MFLTTVVIVATIRDHPIRHSVLVTLAAADKRTPISRLHWAWVVAAVSFIAILGAAGFRSVPGVMMTPHHEFGWSHGVVGLAMSVNMTLFGLDGPLRRRADGSVRCDRCCRSHSRSSRPGRR